MRYRNHTPQRFNFLIECKLNDRTCQFHFSHYENIAFRHKSSFKAGGAFLKSYSIHTSFYMRVWMGGPGIHYSLKNLPIFHLI